MRPCRLLEEEEEEDNGRKRNQFSKDERFVLLSIMGQYAPLLDDKSASVFDRREIWRAIERDFHRAGFTGKTSAQLKKYWQNYKYHGRRAQAVNHAWRVRICLDFSLVKLASIGDLKFAC